MRVVYLDPGLRTDVGHHANYCRYIVGELRARGIETPVFAHRNVEPALQAEFAAMPHFRVDTYAESDGDPICGWLSGFDAFARTTYQDLTALPTMAKSDVVLATSVRPVQMSALVEWRRSVPPERQPTVVMESVGTGLRVERTAEGLATAAPDPRSDPRATLFRFVAKRMPPQAEGRFHVVTFGARPSELFGKLLERPVRTLPLPYGRVTPLRNRAGARPVTVAILGHQKYQKGYDRLPEIVVELLKTRGDFRLLIQHVDTRGPPELQQAMRTVAKESGRVTLDETPAGRTGWPRLLELSDLILCPHRPQFYIAGFSTVAAEGLANGIPLVVPAGTPLETLLAEFGGAGTSFDRFDPVAIADATSRALDDFDRYAGLAQAAALRWPERHGPARMVDALLAMVAG
jgi:glycosyltransferase involved in cell wall biosynthesis